ncbi:Serine protease inhibitor Kazal-type 5 [Mactra antiquata]
MFGFICIALIGLVEAGHDCGHAHLPPCTTIPSSQIDQALVNINLHYNNDLCLELLMIDCAKHVTSGDEIVCGSNGKTYNNHCHFAHARCEYYLVLGQISGQLSVAHTGACTMIMTTTGNVNTAIVTTGSSEPNVATATTKPSIAMGVTNPSLVTEVTTSGTDVGNVIYNLFCNNKETISCSTENNPLNYACGSDGNFYRNSCELSKAKCSKPALTIDPDSSNCLVLG